MSGIKTILYVLPFLLVFLLGLSIPLYLDIVYKGL